jgi:hypothetical protein
MIAVSCDNGDLPDVDTKDITTYVVYVDKGDGLPTLDLNVIPERYTAAKLAELLVERKKVTTAGVDSYPLVYAIVPVAYNVDKHGPADGTKGKIAAKFAGLPVLVKVVN